MFAQEFGSIIAYCYEKYPVELVRHHIPEPVPKQALFVPDPVTTGRMITSAVYQNTYFAPTRIFASDSAQAYSKAQEIAESIKRNRYIIPLRNEDGSVSTEKIRIEDVAFRLVDNRVAALDITWDSNYMIDVPAVDKILQVFIRED